MLVQCGCWTSWPESAAGKFLSHLQGKNRNRSPPSESSLTSVSSEGLLRYCLDDGWTCFWNKVDLTWVKAFAVVDTGVTSPDNSMFANKQPHMEDLAYAPPADPVRKSWYLTEGRDARQTDIYTSDVSRSSTESNYSRVEWITASQWFIFYYQAPPPRRVSHRYLTAFTQLSMPLSPPPLKWTWGAMRSHDAVQIVAVIITPQLQHHAPRCVSLHIAKSHLSTSRAAAGWMNSEQQTTSNSLSTDALMPCFQFRISTNCKQSCNSTTDLFKMYSWTRRVDPLLNISLYFKVNKYNMVRGRVDSSEVVVRVLVWRKAFGAAILHGDTGQVGQTRTGVVESLPVERNLATRRRPPEVSNK